MNVASMPLASAPTAIGTGRGPEAPQRDPSRVSGYASLFGTPDDALDLVLRGAFRRSIKERGAGGIRFLWQHDPARPIGVWESVREDARGLHMSGRLVTGTQAGRDAAALVRAGALDGLSIGFRTRSARRDPATGIRRIHDIDLWEVSLVTFPLHPLARLDVRPGAMRLGDGPRGGGPSPLHA